MYIVFTYFVDIMCNVDEVIKGKVLMTFPLFVQKRSGEARWNRIIIIMKIITHIQIERMNMDTDIAEKIPDIILMDMGMADNRRKRNRLQDLV